MKVGHGLLQWSDALATGVEKIDQQHRILIGILNQANLAFRRDGDLSALIKMIDALADYTLYHFEQEEEMMERSAYGEQHPDDELSHIREHQAFRDSIASYQRDLRQGRDIDRDALFAFLNQWLVGHVMGTDRKFGLYQTGLGD